MTPQPPAVRLRSSILVAGGRGRLRSPQEVTIESMVSRPDSGYTGKMDAHRFGPTTNDVPYNREAGKKPTSLSVNSDLLEKARALGVDLDATLEEALVRKVYRRQREAWLEENREAIEAYNQHVAQHGVFSAGLRGF